MFNRRVFLAAVTATAAAASLLPAAAFSPAPLRAQPSKRLIFPRLDHSGSWLLHSDGPDVPRKIIRRDVVERVFGAGTYETLSQPDHWRMIDAGWFSSADLHQPIPVSDAAYDTWRSFYHPVVEAHDLIADLFPDLYDGFPWSNGMATIGAQLAEHPSTPRYATARVHADWNLIRLADEVAARSPLVEIVLPVEVRHLKEMTHVPV